ncbi:response regulator [Pararobbsia silviterrae]|uniref:Response regulator n=1 Tax=Pararobbsia silviterrae TaxID=1792498 RepID=A0A494X890_9BURK|nr:response regulator [Pararobbsia silviterrae]RKP44229.1 response regulator [Pararobbsia silviterrae]
MKAGNVSACAAYARETDCAGREPGARKDFEPRLPPDPGTSARSVDVRRDAYRVLVVDDNIDACEGTAMLIEFAGYAVEIAFDGPLAIEKALRFRPHVVLLDIAMPRMSGYEVARRLRDHALTRDAILIALTGLGAADDVARAWQAGFDDYRLKPVDIEELLDVLSAQLDRRSLR